MTRQNNDFDLALEYAPDDYTPLDSTATGVWRTVAFNGQPMGVLWNDDESGVGFLAGYEDLLPGASDFGNGVRNMLRSMKSRSISAGIAYQIVQQSPSLTLGDEKSGTLIEAMELAKTLRSDALVAAGPNRVGPKGTINAVFDPDTEEFVDILRSDVTGIYVLEGGDWHRMPDEDESFDGTEWVIISDSGLAFAESKLAQDETPTRDEMLKYSRDN